MKRFDKLWLFSVTLGSSIILNVQLVLGLPTNFILVTLISAIVCSYPIAVWMNEKGVFGNEYRRDEKRV